MLMTKIQFYNWLNPGAKNKKKKKKKKKEIWVEKHGFKPGSRQQD